ncbi:MAG: LamG domain-containing protein, partial [Limisphaerales bacterium]
MQRLKIAGLTAASAALLAGAVGHAQPYSNAVSSLNPAGYWPLSETVAPPSGDYVANNLGSFGAVGNGYYQSWYQPSGTSFYATNSIQRTNGPIGDGTAAMQCNYSTGPGQYVVLPRFTNGVANSALTIQPPFSIEVWANPANTNHGLLPLVTEGRNSVQGDTNNGYASAFAGFSLGTYKNYFYFQVYNTNANSNAGEPEVDIHGLNPGTWYHVVVTFDGTTMNIYSNGVSIASATPPKNTAGLSFVPDQVSPLLIGTGTELSGAGGATYDGGIDEVAIYPTALDQTAIQNHYNAAAATDNSYQTAVLADSPSIYLRLDEAAKTDYPDPGTYPVAQNYGLAGAAANGVYQPGTAPGVAGPPFTGFGASSRAVAINGYYGGVDVGGGSLPAEFNPTTNQPFSITAWFQGNPADCRGRFQDILGHTDSSWRFTLDTASGARFNPGAGPELQFASVADVVTNGFMVNDGKWHFVAA